MKNAAHIIALFATCITVGCSKSLTPIVAPNLPFDTSVVPVPDMPPIVFRDESSYRLASLDLGVADGEPGGEDKIWVLAPQEKPRQASRGSGAAVPETYPCVFVGAAGATSMTGVPMGEAEIRQYMPLVQRGFVVVGYGTDGYWRDSTNEGQFFEAHRRFRQSQAGLVNARNAIECVLSKLKEVDPNRLYCLGHSSAAKLAILLATHDKRIKGCVSLAGYSDIQRSCETDEAAFYEQQIEDWKAFATKASPSTHEAKLSAPIYFYHSELDRVVSASHSKNTARRLREAGKPVRVEISFNGDHGDAVNHVSVAADWLQKLSECSLTGKSLLTAGLTDEADEAYHASELERDDSSTKPWVIRYRLSQPTYAAASTTNLGLALSNDFAGFASYQFLRTEATLRPQYIFPSEGRPSNISARKNGSSVLLHCQSENDPNGTWYRADLGVPVALNDQPRNLASATEGANAFRVESDGTSAIAKLDTASIRVSDDQLTVETVYGEPTATYSLSPLETNVPEGFQEDRLNKAEWHAFGSSWVNFQIADRYIFVVFPNSVLLLNRSELPVPPLSERNYSNQSVLRAGEINSLEIAIKPDEQITRLLCDLKPLSFQYDRETKTLSFPLPIDTVGTKRSFVGSVAGDIKYDFRFKQDVLPQSIQLPFHFTKVKKTDRPDWVLGCLAADVKRRSNEQPSSFSRLAVYDLANRRTIAEWSGDDPMADACLLNEELWIAEEQPGEQSTVRCLAIANDAVEPKEAFTIPHKVVALRPGRDGFVLVECEGLIGYPIDDQKSRSRIMYRIDPKEGRLLASAKVYRRKPTGLLDDRQLGGGVIDGGVFYSPSQPGSRLLWDVPLPYSENSSKHPFSFPPPPGLPATTHHLVIPYQRSPDPYERLWRDTVVGENSLFRIQRGGATGSDVVMAVLPFDPEASPKFSSTVFSAKSDAMVGMPVQLSASVFCSVGERLASFQTPENRTQKNKPFSTRPQQASLFMTMNDAEELIYDCQGAEQFRVRLSCSVRGKEFAGFNHDQGAFTISLEEHRKAVLTSLTNAALDYHHSFAEEEAPKLARKKFNDLPDETKRSAVLKYGKMMRAVFAELTQSECTGIPHPIRISVSASRKKPSSTSTLTHFLFVDVAPQEILDFIQN